MSTLSSKKTVFITGCSDGGIGSALALAFHARGFHVFASARNPSKMAALVNLTDVTLLSLDVVELNQITAAAEVVKHETDGTLDILINNHGRNHFSPVTDIDVVEAKRIFDINFWGSISVMQAFTPLLLKSKSSIVNVVSIAGHTYVPYMGLYSASKRSLEILSETFRLEMKPFGVKVISVVTGAVETNGQTYFEDWKLPENSLFKPIEDVIAARTRGYDGVERANRAEYADEVVDAIIRGDQSKIWCGTNAASTKAMQPQIPEDLLDQALSQGCALEKLTDI